MRQIVHYEPVAIKYTVRPHHYWSVIWLNIPAIELTVSAC